MLLLRPAIYKSRLAVSALGILPALHVTLQAPAIPAAGVPDIGLVLVILAVTVVVLALPFGYLLLRKSDRTMPSLLLVSTDEEAAAMVVAAAKRAGYRAVTVYRYEDALDKLRHDINMDMIVIDDSVPQYEAGLLLAMLGRLTIGIRPLILIHDSSELGQTAPSYRAAVLVPRPLTIKALEGAIRQVADKLDAIG